MTTPAPLASPHPPTPANIQTLLQKLAFCKKEMDALNLSRADLREKLTQFKKEVDALNLARADLHEKLAPLEQENEKLRQKVSSLYERLDRANDAVVARNRKLKQQNQKLVDYAAEIDELYRDNEYFKSEYSRVYIQLERERALHSLKDNHTHTA